MRKYFFLNYRFILIRGSNMQLFISLFARIVRVYD